MPGSSSPLGNVTVYQISLNAKQIGSNGSCSKSAVKVTSLVLPAEGEDTSNEASSTAAAVADPAVSEAFEEADLPLEPNSISPSLGTTRDVALLEVTIGFCCSSSKGNSRIGGGGTGVEWK